MTARDAWTAAFLVAIFAPVVVRWKRENGARLDAVRLTPVAWRLSS